MLAANGDLPVTYALPEVERDAWRMLSWSVSLIVCRDLLPQRTDAQPGGFQKGVHVIFKRMPRIYGETQRGATDAVFGVRTCTA